MGSPGGRGYRGLSYPLANFVDMDIIAFITAVIAVLAAAGFASAWARGRRSEPEVPPQAVIDRAVEAVDRAFAARLQTGQAELEHQRVSFDRKWDGVTARVNEELSGIKTLVTQLQQERASQNARLTESLRSSAERQKELLDTTQRLNDVLVNKQARGQWGERMADDILRAAGLIEGVNYLKQETTAAGTRPDFTFLLPDGQRLHMDVKFPLESYARHLEAASETEARQAIKDFGRAVRDHVKQIAAREAYRDAATTVGYVLMFIPNDGVYAFIHEHCREVFDEALEGQVVICSPSTLFAMLSLVRQAMDTVSMERSSQEILDHLACFAEQWQKYSEQFDLVGRHLDRLKGAFDDLSGARSRQLERQLDRIEELKKRSGHEALAAARAADPDPLLIPLEGAKAG